MSTIFIVRTLYILGILVCIIRTICSFRDKDTEEAFRKVINASPVSLGLSCTTLTIITVLVSAAWPLSIIKAVINLIKEKS